MKLLSAFWRYWKWLCVALMTSFVLLAVLAAIITYFKPSDTLQKDIGACLESGLSWDEDLGACKAPA